MHFEKMKRKLTGGGMAAALAIGVIGSAVAQPPPGPRFGPGPFFAGALLGLGAGALAGAAVRPPPPPPAYYPYPYYYAAPPRAYYPGYSSYYPYYYGYPQY